MIYSEMNHMRIFVTIDELEKEEKNYYHTNRFVCSQQTL
jgi:hypothetical protein